MRIDAPLTGEGALIERIALQVRGEPFTLPLTIVQGIDDDTAVLRVGEQTLLWSADMLIENVHFRLDWTDARSLGWKSLAVNLSDIAAMGGVPAGALLALALPSAYTGDWLDEFVAGFLECARAYGVALLGGDTNRAERMAIDVSVLGVVEGEPLRRAGAQVGDWILVTGALGGARAGLEALLAGERAAIDLTPHFRPVPRLQAGALARQLGATAMMDLSDGLAADLPKLLRASNKGAIVYPAQIPVHPVAVQWAKARGINSAMLAYAGGEDYELLLTAPPDVAQQLMEQLPARTGVPLTCVGTVTDEPTLWLEHPDGRRESPTMAGWDHFGA